METYRGSELRAEIGAVGDGGGGVTLVGGAWNWKSISWGFS